MSSKKTPRGQDKVRFSVGAKLILITSAIFLFSLGSYIALVSWLDLQTVSSGAGYEKVLKVITEAVKQNIYFIICTLCISIFFVWLFSRTISIPVKSLTAAVRQIEHGVFKPVLKNTSSDEIGVLTGSFKKMCSSLQIFGRFSDRDIALRSMRGEIKPEGTAKHATVLFSDIQGFSSIFEYLTKFYGAEAPEKIVQWLNRYFSEMARCVEKTNGVLDKFIGDCVMAHWGAACSSGNPRNDAFNGIKAALMMRKALFFLNKLWKKDNAGNPPIRIGCGINSGVVTAGQIGTASRKEYTVIGDTVNLASHIESFSKSLDVDILISEKTWRLAGDKFICKELTPPALEGKAKPPRLFAVVNFSGVLKGPQSLAEMRALYS